MRPQPVLTRALCAIGIAAALVPLHAQTVQFNEIQRLTNNEMDLSLNAAPGHSYRIEASSNALEWSGLVTYPTNTSPVLTHTDSAAPYLDQRFYRALGVTGTNVVAGDHLNTTNGDVIIQPRYHASFVMQWNGLMVYNDPDSPMSLYSGLPRADLILLSHEHGDHFDASVINAVKKPNTIIVATQTIYNQSPMASHRAQTMVLANGDSTNVLGLEVAAVPAYNLPGGTIYHPKGNGNGYVLTIGGRRIYISGDTADIPEMRALTDIDVAFVCMNLPYTMTVDAAASAAREFQPRVIYPYHFSGSDVNRFKNFVGTDLGIEVRLRKWY